MTILTGTISSPTVFDHLSVFSLCGFHIHFCGKSHRIFQFFEAFANKKSCIILNYLDITSLRNKCTRKNLKWFEFIVKEQSLFHGLPTDQNKLSTRALNFEKNF